MSTFKPEKNWTFDPNDGSIEDEHGYGVAYLVSNKSMLAVQKYGEYTTAIGYLLAAAPKLLAACEWALRSFEVAREEGLLGGPDGSPAAAEFEDNVRCIREAIAEARKQ